MGLDTLPALSYTAAVVAVSCETPVEIIELRQQANYWQAQHHRAVQREAAWKERARQFEQVAREQAALIRELTGQIEALWSCPDLVDMSELRKEKETCHGPDQPIRRS